jgi:hypothetical protein
MSACQQVQSIELGTTIHAETEATGACCLTFVCFQAVGDGTGIKPIYEVSSRTRNFVAMLGANMPG